MKSLFTRNQRSSASPPRQPSAPTSSAVSFIDPLALMRVKNLQLRARAIVEGFYSGIHRSPYQGFSVEFSEFRQYSPGDDLRYFDWRLFARTDRRYVKRFEDETNLRCYLVVDLSRSMAFGAKGPPKIEYARTLAATMAYFLNLQRDAVGLMLFDDRVVDYLAPRARHGQLRRLMAMLQSEPEGLSTNVARPLDEIARTARKRGLVLIISDLLTDPADFRAKLGYLRSRGHEVAIFRILDPAEVDFTFDQPALFNDLESGRRFYVDPDAARADYLRRFSDHAASLATTCRDLGADLITCPTDRPLELSLFDLLRMRTARTPSANRRTAARRRSV